MDKQIIIFYLSNEDLDKKLWNQARELRIKMFQLQEEQDKLKADIYYSSQVEMQISDMPRSKTNNLRDVNDVIEKTESQLRNYEKELLYEYSRILDQIEEYKRVHLAFGTLLPLERELIQELYIKNETWEAVEIDRGINHRILVEKVGSIFENLSEKIDSNLSNTELARQKNTYKLIKPMKKKLSSNDKIKGQTDVYDFFPILEEGQDAKKEQ